MRRGSNTLNVAIYIYDNAEVLDFSGPFEVFSTASRLSKPEGIFNVFLLAQDNAQVNARGGFNVIPSYSFVKHPEIDILIIVGGIHTEELKKPSVINWVSNTAVNAKIVASVCTGAFILAKAGLLSNLKVTTHWKDIEDLKKSFPDLTVVDSQRWVDQGKYVTSGGISAGIDMSLHLVSKLSNMTLAEKTAQQMEYNWNKNL